MRLRRPPRGFTLIELLIVIAILGIIAALILPNFLDSVQKGKQKRSMADIKVVGTAMMAWLTDQSGAAAAAGAATVDLSAIPPVTAANLELVLAPDYIQEIPERDGWGELYDYHLDVAEPEQFPVLASRCLGRDGLAQGDTYVAGAFDPTDYDQDMIWVDGGFLRWPERGGS